MHVDPKIETNFLSWFWIFQFKIIDSRSVNKKNVVKHSASRILPFYQASTQDLELVQTPPTSEAEQSGNHSCGNSIAWTARVPYHYLIYLSINKLMLQGSETVVGRLPSRDRGRGAARGWMWSSSAATRFQV